MAGPRNQTPHVDGPVRTGSSVGAIIRAAPAAHAITCARPACHDPGPGLRDGGPDLDRTCPVVRLRVDGRVTGTAVAALTGALRKAVGTGEAYVVLFDRRAMTAPTKEGRDALRKWSTLMPEVAAGCAGWADVYDTRRAASLRAAGHTGTEFGGYPQRLFDDVAAAERWLAETSAPGRVSAGGRPGPRAGCR